MTQIVHLNFGAIQGVRAWLDDMDARSVFVVADRNAYARSGAKEKLVPALQDRLCVTFDAFAPNPQAADVMRGLACWHDQPCDATLAVGGGSAIDMAKLIGVCSAHLGNEMDVMRGARVIAHKGPPLVAIPTTAGTGSEATHFAVVYVEGQKFSVADAAVLPDVAVVDPDLTASLPASITAHTGLDALSQAVESLWCIHATTASQAFAREAVALVMNHLAAAVHHPTPEARFAMCRAAHLAGKAINISKTTAPHAISYTLTSKFGVPHGLAVALTLGAMLVYNAEVSEGDCCHPEGVLSVRNCLHDIQTLFGCDSPEDARQRIDGVIEQVGCPTRLREVGVETEADLETLVQHVNTERLRNNPRALSRESLRSLLIGLM